MNMSQAPAVALLYIRVSTEEQAEKGLSLGTQEVRTQEYSRYAGLPVAGVFRDVMSGRRADRPGYQDLLEQARQLAADGAAFAVVIMRLDRLGRNARERLRWWDECKELGGEIHSVNEGGRQSEFVYNILAAVAQEESRAISERVRTTWAALRANGWHRPTAAPWGYQWRPATTAERAEGAPVSVLDVDLLAAPLVTAVFQRIAQGEATRALAREIADAPSAQRGGRAVTLRTVQDALRNPLYAGRMPRRVPSKKRGVEWKRLAREDARLALSDRPRGRWPALVDDVTWQTVQDRLASRATFRRRDAFLLAGLLRCPACSTRMRGETLPSGTNRSLQYRYRCDGLRCYATAHMVSVDTLALEEVARLEAAASLPQLRTHVLRAAQRLAAPKGNGHVPIGELEARLQRVRKRGTLASERWLDGRMDDVLYQDFQAKLRTDIAELEEQISQTRAAAAPERALDSKIERLWSTLAQLKPVPMRAAQRAVLDELMTDITPIRERRGHFRLEINWTPLGQALRDVVAALPVRAAAAAA